MKFPLLNFNNVGFTHAHTNNFVMLYFFYNIMLIYKLLTIRNP